VQLVLSEDQELIAKTAGDFMAERSPVSRMRELRDSGKSPAFSRELWREMAELGWVGIPFPESVGGAAMGLAELVLVLEAAGRKLAPEPFLSSVLLGGEAVRLGGSEAQQERWLTGLCSGNLVLTLAHQEKYTRYDLHRITTRADAVDAGWRLSGQKTQVLDADAADALIVAARTSEGDGDREGITLFLVEAGSPGLSVERQIRLDSRGAGLVTLDGVELSRDAVIGEIDGGSELLETVVDRATVGLCAEMLGGMSEAFELTLDYMKEREQFDQKIGSFQALAHRAARIFIEVELSRSTVMAAARALDQGSDDGKKLVSLAKARCSDAYMLAGNEGVQIFGGVGMTDEYDIGLYLKRARASELSFGDAAYHRSRWARLSGY